MNKVREITAVFQHFLDLIKGCHLTITLLKQIIATYQGNFHFFGDGHKKNKQKYHQHQLLNWYLQHIYVLSQRKEKL